MCAAFDAFTLDFVLYRNVVAAIMRMDLPRESDRADLLAMLFVEVGCLGDSRKVASDVEAASRQIAGASFRTVQALASYFALAGDDAEENLALARIVGGGSSAKMKANLHLVSHAPEGTIIGSMVTRGDAVVGVDADVPKCHSASAYPAKTPWIR